MIKILTHQDTTGAASFISNVEATIEQTETLRVEFDKLGIGVFTRNVLNDVVFNDCINVRKTYLETIEAEIKRLKVSTPTLQNNLRAGGNDCIDDLRDSGRQLRAEYSQYLDHISINENGQTFVSDQNRAAILEIFSNYVTTKAGSELISLQQAAVDALNAVTAYAIECNPEARHIGNPAQFYTTYDNASCKFSPSIIQHDFMTGKGQA